MSKSILFIHRSVGQNLLDDGGFYDLLKRRKVNFTFADYNQNTGMLHSPTEDRPVDLGLADTRPVDYAALFSDTGEARHKTALNIILSYDLITIKSCYPNSNIKSDAELEKVKTYYKNIADFFARRPGKELVVMTSPPLTPLRTDPISAARARKLAGWLSSSKLARNVSVFNLFDLLAAPPGSPQANTLRKPYRRWLPFDSHPNKKAAKRAVLALMTFLQG